MLKTKTLIAAVAVSLGLLSVSSAAYAAYPEKDITVVIPKNPGGGTDTTARGVINMMQKDFSVKFLPVNKPDGNGIVGMADLAAAKHTRDLKYYTGN